MSEGQDLQRLYVTLGDDSYTRTKCPVCEERFKVHASQEGRLFRCPRCTTKFFVVIEKVARKKRQPIWTPMRITLAVLIAFVLGYFAGRAHFKSEVLKAIEKDVQGEAPTPMMRSATD